MNYLAVLLRAGERWSYQPPAEHTVVWTAVGKGSILVPNELQQGELVAFTTSSAVLEFEAQSDAEFVLGSAVRTTMTSYWVLIPYIQPPKRCIALRREYRRSRCALFRRERF